MKFGRPGTGSFPQRHGIVSISGKLVWYMERKCKHRNLLLTAAAVWFLSLAVHGQQGAYESPAGTKFLLYTPPGYYANDGRFPLLLSLHSKGEVADDLEELTSKNPEQMPCQLIYHNRWPASLPFIVLSPQLKPDPKDPEIQWSSAYIDEVVSYVQKNFRVDPERIYVTGISRGGTGVWTYASGYPDKVAAILPISGRSDVEQACAIKDIPVWAFHGDNDTVAVPEYSADMINAIRKCGSEGKYNPRLTLLHARDHNGWNEIYNGESGYRIYEWLLTFRKNDTSNKKPYVNAGPDLKIAIRDSPLYISCDAFDWDNKLSTVTWRQTSGSPLTINDSKGTLLEITNPKIGIFEFEVTATDESGARNSDSMTLEITDGSRAPAITQLVLLNSEDPSEYFSLSEGKIINNDSLSLSEINVQAIASPGTASVRFRINSDNSTRVDNGAPYSLKKENGSAGWKPPGGTYCICATPYTNTNGRGNAGVSLCYRITFSTDSVLTNPPPSLEEIRSPLVYPNPAMAGFIELTIAAHGRPESEKIEIIGMRGEVILDENFSRRTGLTTLKIGKYLKPGVYIIRLTTPEGRSIERLLVE